MTRRSLLLVALLALFTGCTSDDGSGGFSSVVTPARVKSVSTLAAYTSFKVQLIRDPASRDVLENIRKGVNELVAAETWDIGTLAAIATANSGYLGSDEGQLVLTGVPLFIDLISGQEVDLKQVEYARAAIEGVNSGFNLALGPAVPAGIPASRAPRGTDQVLLDLQAQARATR